MQFSFREIVVAVIAAAGFAVVSYLAVAAGDERAAQTIFAIAAAAAGFFTGQQIERNAVARALLRLSNAQIGFSGRGEPPAEGHGR